MILSHEHKFIFICNGKTGTTSIEAALAPYHEGAHLEADVPGLYHGKHVPPAVLRAKLGAALWDEYTVFGFVRNPWDWFVSQFFWNHKPPAVSRKDAVLRPHRAWQQLRARRAQQAYLRALTTFSPDEVRATYDLLRQYRGRYDADGLFQHTYVYGLDGAPLLDVVGRFERLTDDFNAVMARLGLDVRLPHRNATTHRSYQSYYTDETAALVGELFRLDVTTFGYTFDASPHADPSSSGVPSPGAAAP